MPIRPPATAALTRRLAPATLVLAVHALLALAWWGRQVAPPPRAAEAPAWLRLLPAAPEPPPAAPVPPGGTTPLRTRPAPAASPAPDTWQVPPAPPLPAAEPQAITPPPAPALPPPPLRLVLPPPAASGPPPLREQMLRDPRANSRPGRAATGSLQALGDPGPALAEETMAGEGHRRVRIGRDCVVVRDARMAQLDPHSQSSSPIPKQVDGCD